MFEPLPALIRLSREQQKLTLDALSTLAGVSRSRLAALEKGDDNISLDLLVKLANALQLKELRIGGLRVTAATPDFNTLVAAAEAIHATQKIVDQATAAGNEIQRVSGPVSALLASVLGGPEGDPAESSDDAEPKAPRGGEPTSGDRRDPRHHPAGTCLSIL